MSEQFAELCAFFGITDTPQTFAELIPWLFTVLVAMGLVLAAFKLVGYCINAGRWLR